MAKILNTIAIEGGIFFKIIMQKIKYIKIVPCYDIEYGVVLRILHPTEHTATLDKSWIQLRFSSCNELVRFVCPEFLKKYKESQIEIYEDDFPISGELCKIRKIRRGFSNIKHLIITPKDIEYAPHFSKDGKFHISLAYVRNNFPKSAKKDPYISIAIPGNSVIDRRIMVSVFSGRFLYEDEVAFNLIRHEYELVSQPIKPLLKSLKKNIIMFKYLKHEIIGDAIIIHIKEEVLCERCDRGVKRRILGIRERAIRARRQRNADS